MSADPAVDDKRWPSLMEELHRGHPRIDEPEAPRLEVPPRSEAVERELRRIEEVAALRRDQDLPVHAVAAGWAAEAANWATQAQHAVRTRGRSASLPVFGWFAEEAAWWPGGHARNPADLDLLEEPVAVAWAADVTAAVPTFEPSPLPNPNEVSDRMLRLGMAAVRDSIRTAALNCRRELDVSVARAFAATAGKALSAWYENRGAAPLAVLDETRRQVEHGAARRHFNEMISEPLDNAVAEWLALPSQPAASLSRLTPLLEAVARPVEKN